MRTLFVSVTGTLIAGCGDPRAAPATRAIDAAGAGLALEVVVAGLTEPVFVGAPPGDDRLFVVERGGRIKIIRGGTVLPTPFLEVPVPITGTEGLLGLAFPPDFAADPRCYILYADPLDDVTVIAERRVSADPDRAAPDERPLVTLAEASDFHSR